jgi:type III pantothenate kinase
MLLAVDIGNTHTVIGLFEAGKLSEHWRLSTSVDRTADENIVLLVELLRMARANDRIDQAIISSVVPGALEPFRHALRTRFGVDALVVGQGIKTGMPILYENPKEVGADRIVNAVAAYDRWHCGLIVVDFGTATTFDCVSPAGEYLGGAIAPGVTVSADALYQRAAKLPRVAIQRPPRAVGRNTEASIQAGLYYGYAGLVDGVVQRMSSELSFDVHVVATGGLASLIAEPSTTIADTDDLLTLRGLQIIHGRNQGRS